MRLFADYHTHTVHSHGTGTMLENVLAARNRGLSVIGITDHGPANPWIGIKHPQVLLDMKDYAGCLNQAYRDIQVLVGCEANIIGLDGAIDLPDQVIRQLDLLLVGFHRYVKPAGIGSAVSFYGYNSLAKLPGLRGLRRKAQVCNTKALVEAVYRYDIDMITHPGLHLSVDLVELGIACAKTDTALEINAAHGTLVKEFAHVIQKTGVQFVINSDAHSPEQVGQLEAGLMVAERLKLRPQQVRNAYIDERKP